MPHVSPLLRVMGLSLAGAHKRVCAVRSRVAAACESPAQECRVKRGIDASPVWTAPAIASVSAARFANVQAPSYNELR